MASHHTFHTPSFGDEEFHLPQVASQLQNNSLMIRGDVNVSGNVSTSGGVQAVYDMTTTNINSSAADTRPAIVANPNNLSAQWSMSNQPNNMRPATDVVTMTGNEFLVLRSPSQQVNPVLSSGDNINPASVHTAGVIDQPVSSDESDDNGVNKSGSRSPGAAAAIIDLKSRLKNDPNAPRKPVSAYALFFGDTQAAIKSQNPNASFGEISKIVASMWDVLAEEHKDVYKKKAEDAKKEYRRLLTIYRSNLLTKVEEERNRRGSADNLAQITQQTLPQPQFQSSNENMTVLNVPVTAGVICINPNQTSAVPLASVTSPTNSTMQNINNGQNVDTAINNGPNATHQTQMCIRNGCQNLAIVSPDWEDEYCSNECVVSHCAEIFSRWVKDYTAAETFAAS